MGVFRMSIVLVVVLALVGIGDCFPSHRYESGPDWHWKYWRSLRQRVQQQQAARRQQYQTGDRYPSKLAAAFLEQQQREQRQKLEEDVLEMTEDILGGTNLEDFAVQLGRDALMLLLKPVIEQLLDPAAQITVDDCITRNHSLGLMGQIIYTVCGEGDAAVGHFHFLSTGDTTPGPETTPQPETTTPEEGTPPPCPTPAPEEGVEEAVDATPAEPDATPVTPETTPAA